MAVLVSVVVFVAVAVAVAVVAVTLPGSAAADPTPVVPADGYGFTQGSSPLFLTAPDCDRELDAVAKTGASWLRVLVDWSRIESSQGMYSWGYLDHITDAAKTRHLKILATVAYTPTWARAPGTSFTAPPVNPSDFGAFSTAVVQRYGDRISNWEIWNEPNLPLFWGHTVDAAGYTELLRAAYIAIKSVQPNSTVVAAGLSRSMGDNAPPIFMAAMYAAGAKGYFDAAAMHPYVFQGGLSVDPQNGWSDVARVHDVMGDNGDGNKKIWMTELGAPTSSPSAEGVTEQEQIRQISDILWASSQTGYSGPAFIYSIRDVDSSKWSMGNTEAHFGTLLTSDWKPKFAASILDR
jgi:hypothetical protein